MSSTIEIMMQLDLALMTCVLGTMLVALCVLLLGMTRK
jgi:hypothetical protein